MIFFANQQMYLLSGIYVHSLLYSIEEQSLWTVQKRYKHLTYTTKSQLWHEINKYHFYLYVFTCTFILPVDFYLCSADQCLLWSERDIHFLPVYCYMYIFTLMFLPVNFYLCSADQCSLWPELGGGSQFQQLLPVLWQTGGLERCPWDLSE